MRKETGMAAGVVEIAAHHPGPGLAPVELVGGPWDGQIAGVRNPSARVIVINGPRHGNHRVWITHRYEKLRGRFEYVRTDVVGIEM
jgi:hypothetical protein